MDWISEQKKICNRFGATFVESPRMLKVGISLNVQDCIMPINGLRHPIEADTTGWYIWAGEYSSNPNFFVPMDVWHLKEYCPIVIKFLGLAPGWRFLTTESYIDVWEDVSLISI